MARLFSSYTHKDAYFREQLEAHMMGLQRRGVVTSWYDRLIVAGDPVDDAISEHLESADIILLLVSSDFIASEYCYTREMTRAMERHEQKKARVIPVILRPCDWHDLPFAKLLAAPRDGKAVSLWANADEAYLDVVNQIKSGLATLKSFDGVSPPRSASATHQKASAKLSIPRQFSDLDKEQFLEAAFSEIKQLFKSNLDDIKASAPDVEFRCRDVDGHRFSAALYVAGRKICSGTVGVEKTEHGSASMTYAMSDASPIRGVNEIAYLKSDRTALTFEIVGMQMSHYRSSIRDKRYNPYELGGLFWDIFTGPLQVK